MIYLLVIVGLIVLGVIVTFNRLVRMRRLVDNAWSDVDVYLKRRADLIPNIVETVKGAADFEKGTLESVTEARSRAVTTQGPTADKAQAETAVGQSLGKLIAIGEAYPALQANQNFLKLQQELSDTERLLADARQYYNACVRDYNILIESFPGNLMAAGAGFKTRDFFQIEDSQERAVPQVSGL